MEGQLEHARELESKTLIPNTFFDQVLAIAETQMQQQFAHFFTSAYYRQYKVASLLVQGMKQTV